MMKDHGDNFERAEKVEEESRVTLGKRTRISVGNAWALVGIAVLTTIQCMVVVNKLEQYHRESLSREQFQKWRDDLEDANKIIVVPHLPPRLEADWASKTNNAIEAMFIMPVPDRLK